MSQLRRVRGGRRDPRRERATAGRAGTYLRGHRRECRVLAVPGSTPNLVLRRRIETAIKLASPLLDLLLFVGDRVSRALEPDDPDYETPRMPHEGESAPRGLRPRS